MTKLRWLFALVPLVACADQTNTPVSGATTATPPGDTPPDTPPASGDASTPPPPPPPGTDAGPGSTCATVFGSAITAVYGRLDGVVRRVTQPGDTTCRQDDNHVLVQIDAAGATYTVWIDVQSALGTGDPTVSIATTTAPLVGPAWASGWHTGVAVDYSTTLTIHSSDAAFQALAVAPLSLKIATLVKPGAEVSAYTYGFATADGGHKVHRNLQNDDGALVILGSGTPSWLLFRFADQVF